MLFRSQSAIKLLNKYCKIVGAMFNTHKIIVGDRNPMLKKATETIRVEQTPRSRYSPTPEPIHYPVIPPSVQNTEESHAESIEPSVPEQNNSFGLLCSESPIGNSEGWDYDYYPGTEDHPIPVYNSEGDGEEEPNPEVAAPAAALVEYMVIDLTSDTEEPMEAQPEQEYPASDGFWPSDTSVTNTSDTEYIPSGRPYVPDTLRRTTRYTGWTPGMFLDP